MTLLRNYFSASGIPLLRGSGAEFRSSGDQHIDKAAERQFADAVCARKRPWP
jgi:hypothetical protein